MVDPNSIMSLRSGVRSITSPLSCPLQGTRLQMVLRKPRSSESNTSWRKWMGLHLFLVLCWPSEILPCPMGGPRQLKHSSNRTYACRVCRRCPPPSRCQECQLDALNAQCGQMVGAACARASPQSSVVRVSGFTIRTQAAPTEEVAV
jgi:hypothetical protein